MLSQQFSQTQIYSLMGLGGAYWFIAALTIRYGAQTLFGSNLKRLITYASLLPVPFILIPFSEALVGVNYQQRLASTTIMTATALLLDGVAYMWYPDLYENPMLMKTNPQLAIVLSRMGAASILWGVGIIFFVALLT